MLPSTAVVFLIIVMVGSQCGDAASLSRRKKAKTVEVDLDVSKDSDALLDAYFLSQTIKYCTDNPEQCSELRLAEIFYKIEGGKSGSKSKTVAKPARKARRRFRRSSSLLFMLFSQVQNNDSPNNNQPKSKPKGPVNY